MVFTQREFCQDDGESLQRARMCMRFSSARLCNDHIFETTDGFYLLPLQRATVTYENQKTLSRLSNHCHHCCLQYFSACGVILFCQEKQFKNLEIWKL